MFPIRSRGQLKSGVALVYRRPCQDDVFRWVPSGPLAEVSEGVTCMYARRDEIGTKE